MTGNLDVSSNNFPEQDLSVFSRFVNLEGLIIGNINQGKEKIEKEIYNRFKGSLEPLKNLSKLGKLVINNTDIDSGLEYLPNSLESFFCSADLRKDAKCQTIYNLFTSAKIEVETKEDSAGNKCIINFPQKLQEIQREISKIKKTQARNLLKDEFVIKDQQIQELTKQLAKKEESISKLQKEFDQIQNKLNLETSAREEADKQVQFFQEMNVSLKNEKETFQSYIDDVELRLADKVGELSDIQER